ncbi:MAG: hypothetical protein LQ348_005565 [Seirophora lacunosa]|nr:MAG: hypothetical protein LQ348_005565 [Seirophora lacunosa]
MKEQTSSIANLASKYDDKADLSSSDDDDDSSSFEEVPKPIERQHMAAKPPAAITEAAAITRKLSSPVSPTKLAAPVVSPSKPASSSSSLSHPPPAPAATSFPGAASDQVTLQDIKALLESQSRTISGQSEKIARLTAEVDRLKTTIGERIYERVPKLITFLISLESPPEAQRPPQPQNAVIYNRLPSPS